MMESTENSIISEVTTDREEDVAVLPEESPSSSSPQSITDPLKAMQNDLHSRGTDLSKAWTSLFSLLTKYQAELTVKENQIDIAERQLETRKQQLSMLNDQVVSPNETSQLQEQLNQKELVLSRCQQELTNTSEMLNRVQTDLSSHMQQLERARHEQLQNHEKLINCQSEITKLKSELMLKQEEIHIKDNLVQKLQNQLVRETSDLNAEISRLKENIESHVRVLDNERRSHEQTRKSVRSLQQNKSRGGGTSQPSVIEIPDSPPTLDLSVEQHDFGLSNIISMSEQQPMEQESHSAQFRHHPYRQETVRTPPMTLSSPTQRSPVNRLGNIHSDMTDRWRSSASATATSQSISSTASDTFFPLSTSAMDASLEQPNISIKSEPVLSGPVPISGPFPGGPSSQGHQSSNDSDTGQSQFPLNLIKGGSTPSLDLRTRQNSQPNSAQVDQNHKVQQSDFPEKVQPDDFFDKVQQSDFFEKVQQSDFFEKVQQSVFPEKVQQSVFPEKVQQVVFPEKVEQSVFPEPVAHYFNVPSKHKVFNSPKKFPCEYCRKLFKNKQHLKEHVRVHTGERPFICPQCGKGFTQRQAQKRHEITHMKF